MLGSGKAAVDAVADIDGAEERLGVGGERDGGTRGWREGGGDLAGLGERGGCALGRRGDFGGAWEAGLGALAAGAVDFVEAGGALGFAGLGLGEAALGAEAGGFALGGCAAMDGGFSFGLGPAAIETGDAAGAGGGGAFNAETGGDAAFAQGFHAVASGGEIVGAEAGDAGACG